jgi:hypothetical protein
MVEVIKKSKTTLDKVLLDATNSQKLNQWLNQFDTWKEIVSVTKSDLVNFILSKHDDSLSPTEIKILLKDLVNRNDKPKLKKPRQKRVTLKDSSTIEALI